MVTRAAPDRHHLPRLLASQPLLLHWGHSQACDDKTRCSREDFSHSCLPPIK
jgi:hypothetical protein